MYLFHSCHNVSGECKFLWMSQSPFNFQYLLLPSDPASGQRWQASSELACFLPSLNELTSRGEWLFPGTASSSFTKGRVSRHTSSPPESWGAEQARTHSFWCLPYHTLCRGSKGTVKSHKLSKYHKFTQNELSIVLGSRSPCSVEGWATNRVLILMRKGRRQYQRSGNSCV